MEEDIKKLQEQMKYMNEQYQNILSEKQREIEWHKKVIERILHI